MDVNIPVAKLDPKNKMYVMCSSVLDTKYTPKDAKLCKKQPCFNCNYDMWVSQARQVYVDQNPKHRQLICVFCLVIGIGRVKGLKPLLLDLENIM